MDTSVFLPCSEELVLQHRIWQLAVYLSSLTTRLSLLVMQNHTEFMATQCECTETKARISELKYQLANHSSAHNCHKSVRVLS